MIELTVPGNPQGKGRARSFIHHGKMVVTSDPKTRTYEGMIRTQAMVAMVGKQITLKPVALVMRAYYPIPDGWPKWKKEAALAQKIAPTIKPDIDNVEKAVKDALNGVVWKDDAQVVTVSKFKFYGEVPRVELIAQELESCYPAQVKTQSEFQAA